MKQARAARTRDALVRAAASEFDRDGYDGASLTRISRTAGVSMGALTFHFSSKEQLADVVRAQGEAITRRVVARVTEGGEPPLNAAVALTLALVGLLEDEVLVRAAARLARERQTGPPDAWIAMWAPVLLEQLRATPQELRSGVDPAAVASLCVLLVRGAEICVRENVTTPGSPPQDAVGQLTAAWRLILNGVTAASATAADPSGEAHGHPPSRCTELT
ncbi:TetR family transcriptional regulator [Streptomyces sp. NPDC052023]|uniref:TetR family transcriptional regulator n=1 Tax=Streptomyces sp. NPDC052023 TaxID=3365681 RepID=UPI0037D31A41